MIARIIPSRHLSHLTKKPTTTMINQQEFVEWCHSYYFDNFYEPGDIFCGEWHECHYPEPKCLGGSSTLLLLREHHAIQGVLQSEEFNHPCIYGWEKCYLSGDLLTLWKKWMTIKALPAMSKWKETPREVKSELGRKGSLSQTREQKQAGGRSAMAKLSPEEKTRRYMAMKDAMNEEKESKRREKATQTTLERDPDHFHKMGRKARDSESYETKAARAKAIPKEAQARALSNINSQKWKCLETGFISTPGPLSRYQRARGIDTSLRIKVS